MVPIWFLLALAYLCYQAGLRLGLLGGKLYVFVWQR